MINSGGFGGVARANDLAAGIDRRGIAKEAAEGAEVDHSARRRPRKRMKSAVGSEAPADDLAARVDRPSKASGDAEHGADAAEVAEVDHSTRRRPQKRIEK